MRILALTAVLVLSACPAPSAVDGGTGGGSATGGGSGGGAGGGTVTPLTLDQYCAALSQLTCDYATRCGYFETSASCAGFLQANGATNACDQARPSVKDGRVAFDGTAAAHCIQDTMTGCTQPASCKTPFAGQVAADGGCYASGDCAPGTYCDANQMMCPGRCLVRAGVGSVVSSSQACLENLTGSFGRIDGGFGYTCVARAALGQACSGFNTCLDGLVCNDASGVCETPRGPNVVCSAADGGLPLTSLCAVPTFCQPEPGTSRWVCASAGAIGSRCGTCRFDLRCAPADGGAVCAPLGLLDDSCGGDRDCRTGLYCKPASGPFGPGTCATPNVAGATCTGANTSCASGLRCGQVPPTDGGFFPEYRCVASDGGTDFGFCIDPTP